jgi:hypothetical protein
MKYEYGDINYHYMPVDHPGVWSYPNDYKYPVASRNERHHRRAEAAYITLSSKQ